MSKKKVMHQNKVTLGGISTNTCCPVGDTNALDHWAKISIKYHSYLRFSWLIEVGLSVITMFDLHYVEIKGLDEIYIILSRSFDWSRPIKYTVPSKWYNCLSLTCLDTVQWQMTLNVYLNYLPLPPQLWLKYLIFSENSQIGMIVYTIKVTFIIQQRRNNK